MFDSGILAKYVGFTEEEVSFLCEKYQMDLGETKRWYDGYSLRNVGHIYNPRSIVRCIREKFFDSYWTKTGTYDSERGEAYIPNEEIRKEFFNAVKCAKWTTVSDAIRNSRKLLEA